MKQLTAPDFQNFFESAPISYLVLNPDFNIVAVSNAYLSATMAKRSDVVGRNLFKVIAENPHAIGVSDLRESLNRVIQQKKSDSIETMYMKSVNSPILNAAGELTHIMHQLIESEENEKGKELEVLANIIPHMIWVTDGEGKISHSNKIFFRFTGLPEKSDQMNMWREVVHPDDMSRITELWGQVRPKGLPFIAEYRIKRADGEYRWHIVRTSPLKDGKDKVIKWFGTATDIHDQKEGQFKLQKAVTDRDDFLSIASHELRTPLTSLSMQLQMIQRNAKKGKIANLEELISKLELTTKQADQIGDLIDGLLDVSRLSTGRMAINREEFDLIPLVQEIANRFSAEAIKEGIEIKIEVHGSVIGYWDRIRITQAVTNLISNAMKYGAKKPIELSTYFESNTVVVNVKDRGIGIAPNDQLRIFERFERAVSNHNISGMGLGLYVTREIVEAHDGRILVNSEPGKGSTFTMELPILPNVLQTPSRPSQ